MSRNQKESNLADSSRVSENVLEYYMKYGKERELEKFMRFRSPKNSPVSSSSAEDASKHLSSEILNKISPEKMESKSKSMPLISNSSSQSEPQEHIIPIQLESDGQQKTVPTMSESKTPQRQSPDKTKQTQTPESAAKVHKRLEWDSLADVGYEKSKSTSNISIVERMLLREFFDVTTNTPKQTNSSESDIRFLEQEIADLGTLKKHFSKTARKDESKYSTPPLAHSTRYESSNPRKNSQHLKAKSVQASTNTTSSLQQKFEKYAQTSLQNPDMKSQEVQVTLKSAVSSPYQASSSVSSFEYQSKNSTHSSCLKSKFVNDDQHPFVKGVKEMLQKRQTLGTKNEKQEDLTSQSVNLETEKIKHLFNDFQQMFIDDKENTSTSTNTTSSSNASTIDFGIQLIFNIMKAKSVDPQQKKKLVKNIVKRITKIANSCELHSIVSKTSTLFTTETDDDKKDVQREKAGGRESNPPKTASVSVATDIEMPNDSNPIVNTTAKTVERQNRQPIIEKNPKKYPNAPRKTECNINAGQKEQSVTHAAARDPTSVQSQSNSSSTTTTSASSSLPAMGVQVTLVTGPDGRVIGATATELEYTTSSSSTTTKKTTSGSTTSPPSTSHDPPTQKPAKTNNLPVSMQEWLDPMTQSEIDFEKKKRASLQKKYLDSRNKNPECREQQLNWIKNEIDRLQSLRNLLLKDENKKSNVVQDSNREQTTQQRPLTNTKTSEQLYDTVFSDQSIQSTAMPQKQSVTSNSMKAKKTNIPSESPQKINKQRSKIDTPSESSDLESISSLVRRRKQELLNHYQPPKLHRCTCVPQPCIIEMPTTSAAAAAAATSIGMRIANQFTSDNYGFYSQPMIMQPMVAPGAYYTYPPPTHAQLQHQNYAEQATHMPHPQSAGDNASAVKTVNDHNVPSSLTHAPPASSSAFHGSSELTVPMGSYVSSATPTTTHQYDDVAAAAVAATYPPGVASQTGPSLRRSKPIYETRHASPYQAHNMIPYTAFMTAGGPIGRNTMCVQTQPSRATAYALQFVVREPPQNFASTSSSTTSTSSTTSSTSAELRILAAQAGPSLQDALQQRRPEFLKQAKNRKSVINRIQKMRQEREQELRKIADENLSVTSLDRKLNNLPPPATERLRLFSTKEMKALSKKRISKLPEVVAWEDRQRDERNKRSNRLLREVYNRRLQKRVRDGKLDFQHSRTLI